MKTKFKFLLVTCVIAAVAITGFNFAQNGSNIDVSLADIAVMAKAAGESQTQYCLQDQTIEEYLTNPPCIYTTVYEGTCNEVAWGSPAYCESYVSFAYWDECEQEFTLGNYFPETPTCN